MLPFQYLFVACAAMWALSQLIPAGPIQIKMQSTSALIMMMIGLTITGVVSIPQFEPEKKLAVLEPATLYAENKSQKMREEQAQMVMEDLARPMPLAGTR